MVLFADLRDEIGAPRDSSLPNRGGAMHGLLRCLNLQLLGLLDIVVQKKKSLWDQLVGYEIISGGRSRQAISFPYQAVSILVRLV